MPEYCEFKDKYLAEYFSNNKRLNHLKGNGLITKDGYIINRPEQYMKKKEIYDKIVMQNLSMKKEREKVISPKKVKVEYINPYDQIP